MPTRINGLSGDVTLSGGPGVTITNFGNDIKINVQGVSAMGNWSTAGNVAQAFRLTQSSGAGRGTPSTQTPRGWSLRAALETSWTRRPVGPLSAAARGTSSARKQWVQPSQEAMETTYSVRTAWPPANARLQRTRTAPMREAFGHRAVLAGRLLDKPPAPEQPRPHKRTGNNSCLPCSVEEANPCHALNTWISGKYENPFALNIWDCSVQFAHPG
jgi:hypothetical protein